MKMKMRERKLLVHNTYNYNKQPANEEKIKNAKKYKLFFCFQFATQYSLIKLSFIIFGQNKTAELT
jgi:hypothetical protein